MSVWYHLLSVLFTLSTRAVASQAHPTPLPRRWDRMTVKHSWNAVPQNWESLGHPPADSSIDLYLALKPRDENVLIDTLHDVSNPGHAKYGAYLTKEQVAELVAPHQDTLNLVNSWLEDHGISSSSVSMTLGGNWMMVSDVPVPQANDILGASYQLYRHAEANTTVVRTVSYSLPEALHRHIQTVSPTTYFGSPRAQWNKPRIQPDPELFVTPSYLRWLYKTLGYVPAATDQNVIGITGYLMEYPNRQDLRTFMTEYRTDGENADFSIALVNGGYDESNPGMEANLDLQFAEAMTYPTTNIFYSTGGVMGTTTDPYLHWLAFVLGHSRVPQTIATSYASNEIEMPRDYAAWLCFTFAQLGARGASVLFASGDWGVGQGECLVHDGFGNVGALFQPAFPASCPWVTSVGGTTGDGPEIAAGLSGGGFSNYFPRPYYQVYAVPPFLHAIGDLYQGHFNPYGRGVPDISAQALNFAYVLNGEFDRISGTSAATPTVAGIISLLNDHLISKGKKPLGFLNPWLYSGGLAGLNDITFGWNPGCGTIGFPATIGWDPVTGLGTPNFEKWLESIDDPH